MSYCSCGRQARFRCSSCSQEFCSYHVFADPIDPHSPVRLHFKWTDAPGAGDVEKMLFALGYIDEAKALRCGPCREEQGRRRASMAQSIAAEQEPVARLMRGLREGVHAPSLFEGIAVADLLQVWLNSPPIPTDTQISATPATYKGWKISGVRTNERLDGSGYDTIGFDSARLGTDGNFYPPQDTPPYRPPQPTGWFSRRKQPPQATLRTAPLSTDDISMHRFAWRMMERIAGEPVELLNRRVDLVDRIDAWRWAGFIPSKFVRTRDREDPGNWY